MRGKNLLAVICCVCLMVVSIGQGNVFANSSVPTDKKMTAAQWSQIRAAIVKGDILVTKDQKTALFNHGHAALAYSGTHTVEHIGTGVSAYYDNTRWSNCYTMRVYYPSGTTSAQRTAAANYAYNNLRGWNYAIYPTTGSTSSVNCATLVWKAYNSQGITLQKWGTGCIPASFVEGTPKTTFVSGVNWSTATNKW